MRVAPIRDTSGDDDPHGLRDGNFIAEVRGRGRAVQALREHLQAEQRVHEAATRVEGVASEASAPTRIYRRPRAKHSSRVIRHEAVSAVAHRDDRRLGAAQTVSTPAGEVAFLGASEAKTSRSIVASMAWGCLRIAEGRYFHRVGTSSGDAEWGSFIAGAGRPGAPIPKREDAQDFESSTNEPRLMPCHVHGACVAARAKNASQNGFADRRRLRTEHSGQFRSNSPRALTPLRVQKILECPKESLLLPSIALLRIWSCRRPRFETTQVVFTTLKGISLQVNFLQGLVHLKGANIADEGRASSASSCIKSATISRSTTLPAAPRKRSEMSSTSASQATFPLAADVPAVRPARPRAPSSPIGVRRALHRPCRSSL